MTSTRSDPPSGFDPRRLGRTYDVAAVREQRARTRELLRPHPGDVVLDLGCGPGHLTSELASQLGHDGRVIGFDRQPDMLTAARARTEDAGVGARCAFGVADATALPLADHSCDGAVVVQVLEYVPDVPAALSQLHRVLRPGARAVLIDTDWRSCVWHTQDRARTDDVLRHWEGHFVHPQLPTVLPRLAREAGFAPVEVHPVPIVETDTANDTYSVGMAATIARFVGRREPELASSWRDDVRAQAASGDYFFALTRFATVLTR